MRLESGGVLSRRRPAENIEAQVVPHDPGEQMGFDSCPVRGVGGRDVIVRLDRRPRRNPQRADPCALVEHFGNVAAPLEHGQTEIAVFNRSGAAAAKQRRVSASSPYYARGSNGRSCISHGATKEAAFAARSGSRSLGQKHMLVIELTAGEQPAARLLP